MAAAVETLPLIETETPADQAALADVVRAAAEQGTPLYPLGGETALDFGMPARAPGWGLSLAGLDRVVDYPARDMTVTVEAGITLAALDALLAEQGQRLPIDAPEKDRATLGGVIATNASGPRRFGQGTMRDYVIGVTAVDGRGTTFHAGGRVVKNVAGYDFCKLLTGSLGTLGVITQVTLKVKPIPRASAFVVADLSGFEQAEQLLAAVGTSQTTPVAVELLAGSGWSTDRLQIAVGLEGTVPEVDWMADQLRREWSASGVAAADMRTGDACQELWRQLTEFPAERGSAAVFKASLLPSAVTRFCELVLSVDSQASIQAHAASGIVNVRFVGLPPSDVAAAAIKRLQPAANAARGSLIILSAQPGVETSRQVYWGSARADMAPMTAVKQQFDPRGILNPGRFIFPVP